MFKCLFVFSDEDVDFGYANYGTHALTDPSSEGEFVETDDEMTPSSAPTQPEGLRHRNVFRTEDSVETVSHGSVFKSEDSIETGEDEL